MTSDFFVGIADGQIAEELQERSKDDSEPPDWWLEQEAEHQARTHDDREHGGPVYSDEAPF